MIEAVGVSRKLGERTCKSLVYFPRKRNKYRYSQMWPEFLGAQIDDCFREGVISMVVTRIRLKKLSLLLFSNQKKLFSYSKIKEKWTNICRTEQSEDTFYHKFDKASNGSQLRKKSKSLTKLNFINMERNEIITHNYRQIWETHGTVRKVKIRWNTNAAET